MALPGRGKGRYPLEVGVMEWWLAEVIKMTCGVACSWWRGVVESAKLIVQPMSAAMVDLVRRRGLGVEVSCLS